MSSERKHHPFSPSKLQYLEACPGFLSQSSEDNEASLAGTLQHTAVEESLHLDDPRLTDDHAEAVVLCKRYREEIAAKYPGGTRLQEDYLPIDDVTLTDAAGDKWRGTTAGYLDFAVVSADQKTAEICDWKFGAWSVEPAENNLQGIAYLLGLVKCYPQLETVTVHFFMPHRGEVDVATFKRDQFSALYLRVCTVVQRALAFQKQKNSEACSMHLSSCLFCGRKGLCEKLAAFVLKLGKKYSPLEVPADVTPSSLHSAADSSSMMGLAQLMESWAKAIRAQITARAIEDDAWMPEGYDLRDRSANSVKDWRKVLKAAKAAGVPPAAIREALTLRMTPINQAVNDSAPRGQKKAALKDFTDSLLASGALEKDEPVYFLQRQRT